MYGINKYILEELERINTHASIGVNSPSDLMEKINHTRFITLDTLGGEMNSTANLLVSQLSTLPDYGHRSHV